MTIAKDLSRTRPKETLYKRDYRSGANPLYNVLLAYAIFDPKVGYCQGMSFIVDILYRNLNQNEELCFLCLVHLMKIKDWRGCFSEDMEKLIKLLDFFE